MKTKIEDAEKILTLLETQPVTRIEGVATRIFIAHNGLSVHGSGDSAMELKYPLYSGTDFDEAIKIYLENEEYAIVDKVPLLDEVLDENYN